MAWVVKTAGGTVVESGNSDSVTFDAGNQVELTMPASLSGNFNIAPEFRLNNSIEATFEDAFETSLDFKILPLDIHVPSKEVIPEYCAAGVCVGPVASPEINIGPFGIFESVPVSSTPNNYVVPQSTPWELPFDAVIGAPFTLNPELRPTAGISGPATRKEGQSGTWSSTSTDPDPGDSLTYLWDFGDGTTTSSGTHTYADNATYTLRLTVTDSHGWSHSATKSVTVSNVTPTVTGGADKGTV